MATGVMETSLLKPLLRNISGLLHLSFGDNGCCKIVEKYYIKMEEVLKLVKPVLESIIDDAVISDELQQEFAGISQSVDELKEVFEDCHPLMSKVYFVMKVESLFSKVQTHGVELFKLLQSSSEVLPELGSASLEHCIQKIKHIQHERASVIISKAISDLVAGSKPSSEIRSEIANLLSLNSNQELLIEAVALENLKEHEEQAEDINEVEYIEEMISLVTHMHGCFIEIEQSQGCNSIPIPADFCCPLSLKLMADPVIVASGQTYERTYIRNWIDLGITVCPKTMQTLVHTNLIPNYTVKALIENWCNSNDVKLPDPATLPRSVSSTGKNLLLSSETNQEEDHVHSCSEDGMPGSGHELVDENHRLTEPGEISLDSSGPSSMSTSRKAFSAEGSLKRTISTSSEQELSHDANEVLMEAQPAITTRERKNALSPRIRHRSRNQIWRKPSERFGIPSGAEVRPDLSEVETQVKKLVSDLSSTSLDDVKNATGELRLLARHNMDNRIVIANCGAIALLITLLHSDDLKIQENSVTTLLNLSINDVNKTAIGNADAIESLIHVLKTGSSEAKENSAATLFSLSAIEDNKVKIGRSGAVGPLVDLLGHGTPRGKKDAATALFNLSIIHENKARIVEAGAVRYLVELMDPAAGMADKAVAVLSNLATIYEGRTAIGKEGGIPMLVEVVELGSARGKENAAAALLQLCTNSSRFCNMVLQEAAVPPLVALSQTGTPRAKEKAQSLLSYFRNQRRR